MNITHLLEVETMKLTKLNDVYENWLTGDGVFTDLNNFDVPWKNENNVIALNTAYHGNHSGDKNISPIVYKFLNSDESDNMRTRLASAIFTMFNDKWSRLWLAFQQEYDPISNYDMTENETISETTDNTETHTGTDTTTHTGTTTKTNTGTDTTTRNGSETERHTGTDTTETNGTNENEISAFNSTSYQDNSQITKDETSENEKDLTDTRTYNNVSDVETVNLSENATQNLSDANTKNLTDNLDGQKDIVRDLTRSGNIGVTTTQQMLTSEIELRKWLYYQSVFNDIDSILTLSIY